MSEITYKVKGSAIENGSIPLSALNNEVTEKIENAGGGADWNAKGGEAGYIKNKPFGFTKVIRLKDLNPKYYNEDEEEVCEVIVPLVDDFDVYTTTCQVAGSQDYVIGYDYFKIKEGVSFEYGISKYNDSVKCSIDAVVVDETIEGYKIKFVANSIEYSDFEDSIFIVDTYNGEGCSTISDNFIPDTITRKSNIATINGQTITNGGNITIAGNSGDSPIVKGDADNSAVLDGEYEGYSNKAISQNSVALGVGTTAGLKGWYYKAVQIGTDPNVVYLYLTTEQQEPMLVTTAAAVENQEKNINISISKGDVCSIINGTRLIDCFKFRLNEISNYGRISFTYIGEGTNPLSIIQDVEELKLEDYSVFCISKPDYGIVELSKSSIAMGLRSTAAGITSYAEGQDTIAIGECAHAEGAFTKSNGIASHTEGFGTQTEGLSAHAEGYNTLASGGASHSEGSATKAIGLHSHAEGDTTEASGEQSHAEGKQTIAEGEHSHSEGYWTKAHGKSSHVEGQGLNNTTYSVASGDYSHSEGFYTRAFGTGSHTEGTYTIAYNKGEHAEGIYNKSTENVTLHSVGIGTSANDRKNAHEITNDGKHYILGVGNYDGTNIEDATDVAMVINDLKNSGGSSVIPDMDYVILKYMMNPIVITPESSNAIPDELFPLIIDEEGHIKPIAAKLFMLLLDNDMDDNGEVEYVITTSVFGCWNDGSDGEIHFANGTKLFYIYDDNRFSKIDA